MSPAVVVDVEVLGLAGAAFNLGVWLIDGVFPTVMAMVDGEGNGANGCGRGFGSRSP